MDSRVYIEDIMGDEIEVDLLVRDSNHNMVGVYMEGPMAGHEIVLTRDMIQDVTDVWNEVLAAKRDTGE